MGACISAGADRMTAAGLAETPQMISIGCDDLVDFVGWQEIPGKLVGQEMHAHKRLLSSVMITADQRRAMAREIAASLPQPRVRRHSFCQPTAAMKGTAPVARFAILTAGRLSRGNTRAMPHHCEADQDCSAYQ
jgi:uncharacterized protein (UPF0261 family)